MKTLNYFLLFVFVAFFASCQKDEITVNLKQSGKVSVELKDSTGKVFSGVKVSLGFSSYADDSKLDSKRTNTNGKVDFGELQAGTYYITTDTIKIGNKYFFLVKPIQVISGTTKTYTLDPYEYTGNITYNISFINNSTTNIIPTNVKLALVKRTDYSPNANRQKVLSKAVDNKTLNANGSVTFTKVPSSIYYYAYIYLNDNDSTGYWIGNTVSVSKDGNYSYSTSISVSSLIIIRKNFELTLNYYSYDYSTQMPVKNLNVVLVRYADYQNYSLRYADNSTILSYKFANGTTNTSGKVVFSNVPVGEYYAFGYYSDTYKTWISSYIGVYESSSNTMNATVTGSDLGLN